MFIIIIIFFLYICCRVWLTLIAELVGSSPFNSSLSSDIWSSESGSSTSQTSHSEISIRGTVYAIRFVNESYAGLSTHRQVVP